MIIIIIILCATIHTFSTLHVHPTIQIVSTPPILAHAHNHPLLHPVVHPVVHAVVHAVVHVVHAHVAVPGGLCAGAVSAAAVRALHGRAVRANVPCMADAFLQSFHAETVG